MHRMASTSVLLLVSLAMLAIASCTADAADVASLKWTGKIRFEEYKRFEPHMWIMIGVPVAIITAMLTMFCRFRCCCRLKKSR
ncbi:Uncharacterized protein PBTT_00074 [Plasmodiophora brassicae]